MRVAPQRLVVIAIWLTAHAGARQAGVWTVVPTHLRDAITAVQVDAAGTVWMLTTGDAVHRRASHGSWLDPIPVPGDPRLDRSS